MDSFVREGVIKLRTELIETKLKAPDISGMTRSIDESNQKTREAAERTTKLAEETEKLAEVRTEAENLYQRETEQSMRARSKLITQQRELNDSILRGADGFRTFTDGAFAASRGLALVSLESEENLQQVVRRIAEIQGQFDLLRGGIDTVRGGIETVRGFGDAWRVAGGPIALAGTRLGAVAAFLGPAGTVAVAAGGTAIVLGALWTTFADQADEAIARTEERLEDLRRKTAELREEQRIERESEARLAEIRSDAERFQVASDRLANVVQPVSVTDLINQSASVRARDEAREERVLDQRRLGFEARERFLNEERLERRRREFGAADQRLESPGGAVSRPERDLFALQTQNALINEQRRLEIIRTQRDAFRSLRTCPE